MMNLQSQIEDEASKLYNKALLSVKGKYNKCSPEFKKLIVKKIEAGSLDFTGKLSGFTGDKESLLSTIKAMNSSDIVNKYHQEAHQEFYS